VGFLTLTERLEKSFDTFDRMEKHWGHFYNWYDTRTLRVLPPSYISTVDSGNLLGSLVALKQGLKEKAGGPLIGPEVGLGFADTLGLAIAGDLTDAGPLQSLLGETPGDLTGWDDWLGRVDWGTTALLGHIKARAEETGHAADDREAWVRRLAAQVRARRAELAALAPWLAPLRDWEEKAGAPWATADTSRRWGEVRSALVDQEDGIAGFADRADDLIAELDALGGSAPNAERFRAIAAAVRASTLGDLVGRLRRLGARAEALASGMDFRPDQRAPGLLL
ncbi:MAG: hypothetical protein LC745_06400, partial [Planctomycetia bacterium]|nr:hypothetical protein [Planctomycetia bacterium]